MPDGLDMEISSSESSPSDSEADNVSSNILTDGDGSLKSNKRLRFPKPIGIEVISIQEDLNYNTIYPKPTAQSTVLGVSLGRGY
jgi:hypothetical protein